MVERKDKDPVFGRLDDLDDVSSLPLGLRNGGSGHRGGAADAKPRPASESRGGARREDTAEPGPAISVVSSLTNRTQSATYEMDETAPGHPGAAMRFARERLGLDAADLAARTRLSRRIIEDLESNRFDAMPPAYVRGYMRAVARELDGDADAWIRSYEGMGFSEPVLKATVHRNASARWGLSGGVWGLMVGAILVSALGLGVYAWTEGDGASPVASLKGWFSDTAQRFVRAPPEAASEPEPDQPPTPARETAQELQWVPGPEPVGPLAEPLDLDGGLTPPVPPAQEPEQALPHAEPAAPAAEPQHEPGPAQRESTVAQSAVTVPEPEVTVAPEPEVAAVPATRPERSDDPQAETPAAPNAAPITEVPAAPAQEELAVPAGRSALSLSFDGTSWIEVRSASDRVALRGIFHAGDERNVVVEMPARVILGNAPAVRLSRDGRPVALEAHTREDRTARLNLGAD